MLFCCYGNRFKKEELVNTRKDILTFRMYTLMAYSYTLQSDSSSKQYDYFTVTVYL